jgi:thiosulfate/3-mercaptopyruvate sulfurtransferase
MNLFRFLLTAVVTVTMLAAKAQNPPNWTEKQLLEPATLAGMMNKKAKLPLIYSVGPGALIPGSIDIGMTNDKANMDKLKKELSGKDRKSAIVLYCGCCPFEHCPNVRPAIALLQEMKFTNYQLLNLPKNLKSDWVSKGYPTNKL